MLICINNEKGTIQIVTVFLEKENLPLEINLSPKINSTSLCHLSLMMIRWQGGNRVVQGRQRESREAQ